MRRQILDGKGDRLVRIDERFLDRLALAVAAWESGHHDDVPAVGVGLEEHAVLRRGHARSLSRDASLCQAFRADNDATPWRATERCGSLRCVAVRSPERAFESRWGRKFSRRTPRRRVEKDKRRGSRAGGEAEHPVARASLCQKGDQRFAGRRQVVRDDVPCDVQIDVKVVADQPIAHACIADQGMSARIARVSGVRCFTASPMISRFRTTASCTIASLKNRSRPPEV